MNFNVKEDIIDMEDIDNKLEFAKRMAKEFDVNNRYYEACHFENDIHFIGIPFDGYDDLYKKLLKNRRLK